jgi:hypothetical protein
MGVKALSLRQPWLWLVLHAGKNIENRKQWKNYRGPIFLHASQTMTKKDYDDCVAFLKSREPYNLGAASELLLPQFDDPVFLKGGIAGRTKIYDAIRPCTKYVPAVGECNLPWHMHDQNGFLLRDTVIVPFVPCKGALGLFDLPEDIVQKVMPLQGGPMPEALDVEALLPQHL